MRGEFLKGGREGFGTEIISEDVTASSLYRLTAGILRTCGKLRALGRSISGSQLKKKNKKSVFHQTVEVQYSKRRKK